MWGLCGGVVWRSCVGSLGGCVEILLRIGWEGKSTILEGRVCKNVSEGDLGAEDTSKTDGLDREGLQTGQVRRPMKASHVGNRLLYPLLRNLTAEPYQPAAARRSLERNHGRSCFPHFGIPLGPKMDSATTSRPLNHRGQALSGHDLKDRRAPQSPRGAQGGPPPGPFCSKPLSNFVPPGSF